MNNVLDSIVKGAINLVHGSSQGYGQILTVRTGSNLVTRYTTNPEKENGCPADDLNQVYDIDNCNVGISVKEKIPIIVPKIDEHEYHIVKIYESKSGRQGSIERKRFETVTL